MEDSSNIVTVPNVIDIGIELKKLDALNEGQSDLVQRFGDIVTTNGAEIDKQSIANGVMIDPHPGQQPMLEPGVEEQTGVWDERSDGAYYTLRARGRETVKVPLPEHWHPAGISSCRQCRKLFKHAHPGLRSLYCIVGCYAPSGPPNGICPSALDQSELALLAQLWGVTPSEITIIANAGLEFTKVTRRELSTSKKHRFNQMVHQGPMPACLAFCVAGLSKDESCAQMLHKLAATWATIVSMMKVGGNFWDVNPAMVAPIGLRDNTFDYGNQRQMAESKVDQLVIMSEIFGLMMLHKTDELDYTLITFNRLVTGSCMLPSTSVERTVKNALMALKTICYPLSGYISKKWVAPTAPEGYMPPDKSAVALHFVGKTYP
jgi:hypothetical protein